MLKILVVTYHPWRDDISVGNTLSNIFRGMEDKIEFANLYVRDDRPCNNIAKKFFHISERAMMHNMLLRKDIGEEVLPAKETDVKESFSKSYNSARRLRWDVFLLAQDLLGVFGKWQSMALDDFIKDFKPNLIFGPLGRVPISNMIMSTISKKYKIPLVAYSWDDHYTLRKYSFSPFFWLRLFLERKYICKCAKQSEFLYTITPLMKKEYSRIFQKECKLLYKGFSFDTKPKQKDPSEPIRIIYMGNIGAGRFETLAKIVSVINRINVENVKFRLDIYTTSPITEKISTTLNKGECRLMKPVHSDEVMNTMQQADILLHVEPQSLKEKLLFRLSFSTKIVDYLYNAKCILAVGEGTGTIEYLKENQCAVIVNNPDGIEQALRKIYNDTSMLNDYSNRAWNCGLKNHQISEIQAMLLADFNNMRDADK